MDLCIRTHHGLPGVPILLGWNADAVGILPLSTDAGSGCSRGSALKMSETPVEEAAVEARSAAGEIRPIRCRILPPDFPAVEWKTITKRSRQKSNDDENNNQLT